MTIDILITNPSEVFSAAIDVARTESAHILKLADLRQCPLAPGETADARRHQIAKHAKKLAEAFLVVDSLVLAVTAAHAEMSDVTAGPVNTTPTPVDPDAN